MPEVKDALELVKDQVVAGAGNYMDKAEPYINKLNNWTSRLNGYMERFEDVANNVNALLQVTMLRKIHLLCCNLTQPLKQQAKMTRLLLVRFRFSVFPVSFGTSALM